MGVDIHEPVLPLFDILNEEGGIAGHPVELIIANSESDATKAVINAKRLITEDDIHMLLGDAVTGITIPVGLTAAEHGIVHLAHSGSEMFEMTDSYVGDRWMRAYESAVPASTLILMKVNRSATGNIL